MDGIVEAVVQAGSRETCYRRVGSGRPVLLLGDERLAGTAEDGLLQRLSRDFRVIAPVFDTGGERLRECLSDADAGASWLAEIIDGLGLRRTAVVIAAALTPDLFARLEGDRERIDRVAVLRTAEAAGPGAVGRIPARPDGLPLLTLVLAEPGAATGEAVLEALVRFLAGVHEPP